MVNEIVIISNSFWVQYAKKIANICILNLIFRMFSFQNSHKMDILDLYMHATFSNELVILFNEFQQATIVIYPK